MSKFAEPVARLIDELKKLPGVGSKSAQRYAFHILRGSDEDAEALAVAIRHIKEALRLCSVCNNITDVDLSPIHGISPEQLRIGNLLRRAEAGEIDEVILATNPTVEGEATAVYLAQQLKPAGVRVTRIATGIPAGSDIEYADEVTLRRAMDGRREM